MSNFLMKTVIPLLIILILSNCRTRHPQEWELYYYNGNYDKAELELNRIVEKLPDYWEAYYWIGKINFEKAEYMLSVINYKKAISLDSTRYNFIKNDLKNSYYELAELYYNESKYDSSAFYYRKALTIKDE